MQGYLRGRPIDLVVIRLGHSRKHPHLVRGRSHVVVEELLQHPLPARKGRSIGKRKGVVGRHPRMDGIGPLACQGNVGRGQHVDGLDGGDVLQILLDLGTVVLVQALVEGSGVGGGGVESCSGHWIGWIVRRTERGGKGWI